MHCPFCAADDTKVIDSRLVAEGDSVRRRRECQACGERFTTFETAELVMPRIVKRDGKREPFNEEKLKKGDIIVSLEIQFENWLGSRACSTQQKPEGGNDPGF